MSVKVHKTRVFPKEKPRNKKHSHIFFKWDFPRKSLISIQVNFSMVRKDLQALTLGGLTGESLVLDALSEHLDNRLYI